jgi:hypothetical protein
MARGLYKAYLDIEEHMYFIARSYGQVEEDIRSLIPSAVITSIEVIAEEYSEDSEGSVFGSIRIIDNSDEAGDNKAQ